MARTCLLIAALVGCAPVVARAPETSPAGHERAGAKGATVRARVARLAPPFAARTASRRVLEAPDGSVRAQPLAELARE